MLTVGSLFSGIGGLDLGLERAGMRVRWQSEIDPFASRVLAKHWPATPNLGDVTKIDWSKVEPVDLICGGYPCQPFSLAGARLGGDDARHLWPYFATALRELRPRYALLENVPGHLSLGFGRVLGDLAESGFDAEWDCIPAAAVGAPHLRYRVFIVAYANGGAVRDESDAIFRSGRAAVAGDDGAPRPVADADRQRQSQPVGAEPEGRRRAADSGAQGDVPDTAGDTQRTGLRQAGAGEEAGRLDFAEPPDSGWWDVEPDVGRVADGVPARMDRLRTLGNAVVPQVAEWIGRRIVATNSTAPSTLRTSR